MTYTKVHEILTQPDGELAKEYAWLVPHLENLNSFYRLSLAVREKRGAIEFDSQETLMVFNENGKIDRIEPTMRNDAHRLIEECMLAANVCAADFLKTHEHPALYRIHEGPTPEKLEALRTFMGEFGFGVGGGDTPHAKDYGKLLARIKGRPDEQLLQTVLLRSMQQAVYSPDNVGHFGLAYEAYAHFTSPIRRYPDLIIHRAIKSVLKGERYQGGDFHQLGQHCSMTERRADDATRDVQAWLKCFYMQDKIGEDYDGTVAGVTSFGLFVALDGVYVEGLLHVTELGNDYFNFDKARHEMAGERTGVKYRLGDRLRVKVSRVDLETSRIDFVLADTNKLTPISEEDSILPERYRNKGGDKKATVIVDAKQPERKILKVSAPWDANSAPKSSRAKKANTNKNRSHKAGSASSKPNAGSKTRPAKSAPRK
jgi:ribonuclease R